MNSLNYDLKLQLGEYFYVNNFLSFVKLWYLDKNMYPIILYVLRKYRSINSMEFDFSWPLLFSKFNNELVIEKRVLNAINKDQQYIIKYLLSFYKFSRFSYELLLDKVIQLDDINILKIFIQHIDDIRIIISRALRAGNIVMVKYLVKTNESKPNPNRDYANIINHIDYEILPMSRNRYFKAIEIIKYLAPRSTNKNYRIAIDYINNYIADPKLITFLEKYSTN